MTNSPDDTTATSTQDDAAGEPARQSWLVRRGVLLEPGPRRLLALASFVNMVGSSVFMVSAALFYTRSIGLSVTQVGIGMGVGSLVGLLAGMPVGRLADRRGPREIYLLTLGIQAVAMVAFVIVGSFWLFVVVLCITQLAQSASQAARAPIVRRFAGEKPAKFRAYLRSAANLASSMGALLAAVVIQLDTDAAYTALVLGNALSFLASAAIISRLPSLEPLPKPPGASKWGALVDRPYVVVTALDGFMSMQYKVLTFALPLWIVGNTDAPRWFVGVTALLNTVMVIVLQVRASRGVDTNTDAARVWRRSGFAFLFGMALIGVAAGLTPWVAAIALLVGVAIHTVGELWQAAGSFELRYNLAPAHAQGQYSGLFSFGNGLVGVVSPTLLALLCITWGTPGWLVLGGVFVAIGLVMPSVIRWADRTRPKESVEVA